MGYNQYFYEATKELALTRGDWFLARNLVKNLEKKLGEPVSSERVAWYLTRLVDAQILESRKTKSTRSDGINEYRVKRWPALI